MRGATGLTLLWRCSARLTVPLGSKHASLCADLAPPQRSSTERITNLQSAITEIKEEKARLIRRMREESNRQREKADEPWRRQDHAKVLTRRTAGSKRVYTETVSYQSTRQSRKSNGAEQSDRERRVQGCKKSGAEICYNHACR